MFFKKQTSIDAIIVGLGNPGKKYEGTRHNAGFAALDHVAEKWGMRVTKAKFDALTGTGTAAGVKVLLMKPQTFMNLSGDAVRKAADFYKVPPERIIVLFDDISPAHPENGLGGRAQRHQKHHWEHRAGFPAGKDRRGGKAASGVRPGGLGAEPTDAG